MSISRLHLLQILSVTLGCVGIVFGLTSLIGHTWVGCQSTLYRKCITICHKAPVGCVEVPENWSPLVDAMTPIVLLVVFGVCGNVILIVASLKSHTKATSAGSLVLLLAGCCGLVAAAILTASSINLRGSAYVLLWIGAIFTLLAGVAGLISGFYILPPDKTKKATSYEQIP
ncbi:uncharacterized protein LOC143452481 [Clavelina lepadiformis]|uniref:Uncharacterized protein n=1 Tax=Clavelina lepadiformis TaxID=159417 RepID=A0ABP0FRB6_CLALP